MKSRDLAELFLLAAIWGGSFLLMRIAAPSFGPFALIELRVGLAAAVLIPILAFQGGVSELLSRWRPLLMIGLTASALPFVLYAWATLSVTAGFAAIVNATTPMFTALVAWVWLKDKLSTAALVGMVVGVFGVAILVWGKVSFKDGGSGWAVLACLGATLSYGIAGSLTKRFMTGVSPMVTAAGSQLYAAVLLLPPAVAWWPAQSPTLPVWGAATLLAVVCSGLAYVLFFRLMSRLGPTRTVTVTFLIPVFGMFWGAALLDEKVSLSMLAGCAVILLGTGLATGLLERLPRPWRT
ncbi:DMT family transporter [Azoarcus sp. L1K30]|uniref:DMT family transporter n=1 Tax=Azoarcus sp. L1K30 TaxID=2820277 RepID=UPI001B836759|nr:DMT family transporter [Azoarcus sp. L1K30]MBR0565868.1 DMT family transporter [Azoarcus sp. L1K30]